MMESPPQSINPELSDLQESMELKREFAAEIRKPYENSYLKKLQRLAGAFVLAGITVFSPFQKESVAPELSQEFLTAQSAESFYKLPLEKRAILHAKILKHLAETGGVEISPQLPESIYKAYSATARDIAFDQIADNKLPYFSKAEVILGKQFIRENPLLAKEYLKKIEKAMKATVKISTNSEFGSGVFINTKEGQVILTNAHVAGELVSGVIVSTIKGKSGLADTVYIDVKRDLAILKFQNIAPNLDIEEGTETLAIDKTASKNLKDGENLAAIGHPLGFPYEVEMTKLSGYFERDDEGLQYKALIQNGDQRFKKLASYSYTKLFNRLVPKGQILPGMSGGPLIALDRKGGAELVGLNTFMASEKTYPDFIRLYGEEGVESINGAVSADEIREFIKNYESRK